MSFNDKLCAAIVGARYRYGSQIDFVESAWVQEDTLRVRTTYMGKDWAAHFAYIAIVPLNNKGILWHQLVKYLANDRRFNFLEQRANPATPWNERHKFIILSKLLRQVMENETVA